MNIYITGSIAYDYIMRYPGEFKEMLEGNLDDLSVSFLVDDLTRQRGGVAPNIAYTLALLGERPVLVGTAGHDFGEYKQFLDEIGVDTRGVRIQEDLFTASFFVSTDQINNQIGSFYIGAMARARDLALSDVVNGSLPDLVVISPNDPQAMRNIIAECKDLGIRYLYDPSQQIARMDGPEVAEGVEGAYLLVVNTFEHEALCRKAGLTPDDLLNMAENVIVTRGKNGADFFTSDGLIHVPVYPTETIIDPTGVGDAFRSGLLKGLSAGWSWELTGRVASLAAAYTLEKVGPQNHHFTPQEFVARFRKEFDDQGALDAWLAESES
ncbi:MAG: carbohydrate kinase family protein [Chloroflexi bacterium]|nr:carbohydrate kinase family protein [Chloroflexota bacterium]